MPDITLSGLLTEERILTEIEIRYIIYAEISLILDTIDTIVTKLPVATLYNQLNVTMLCMTLNTVSTLQINH